MDGCKWAKMMYLFYKKNVYFLFFCEYTSLRKHHTHLWRISTTSAAAVVSCQSPALHHPAVVWWRAPAVAALVQLYVLACCVETIAF